MSLDTKLNRHAVRENDGEEERVSLWVRVFERVLRSEAKIKKNRTDTQAPAAADLKIASLYKRDAKP